jgi:hypothetical protein
MERWGCIFPPVLFSPHTSFDPSFLAPVRSNFVSVLTLAPYDAHSVAQEMEPINYNSGREEFNGESVGSG